MLEALQPLLDGAEEYVLIAMAVFLRIGAAAYFLPGIGERYIPARVKLGGALSLAVIVTPMIEPQITFSTRNLAALAPIFAFEALSGVLIGLAIRFLVFALQTGGTLIAQNLSLSQMFGAGVGPDPEPTIATFLTLGGIALALVLGLHVEMVATLAESYQVLPFGVPVLGSDTAQWTTERASDAFELAVSVAMPFIVIAFVYNLALGAMNRAMPQLMVSFVGMPFITGMGMLLLALTMPAILMMWRGKLETALMSPLGGL